MRSPIPSSSVSKPPLTPEVWAFRIGNKVGVQFLTQQTKDIAKVVTRGDIDVPEDTTVWLDEDVLSDILDHMPNNIKIYWDISQTCH